MQMFKELDYLLANIANLTEKNGPSASVEDATALGVDGRPQTFSAASNWL